MGSSHCGEMGLGSGRSGSSRRGKKSATDKQKQPQRGLGIAQLEKIRLHNQIAGGFVPSLHGPPHGTLCKEDTSLEMTFSSSPSSFHASSSAIYGFHPNFVMGYGDMERRDVVHGESQSGATACRALLSHSNVNEPRHLTRPSVTLPLLRQQPTEQDWVQKNRRQECCDSMCSSSDQNSEESDTQELDLELKLSL